jgi:hypothetical protein
MRAPPKAPPVAISPLASDQQRYKRLVVRLAARRELASPSRSGVVRGTHE